MVFVMTAVIDIQNLTKNYGDIVAVNSLDLDVNEGEVFGFLGPNGAGKTTTIKTIMGLIKPTNGEVSVNGKSLKARRREATIGVGYLPENIELYDNLTGRETLKFFAEVRHVSKDEIEPLLEKVELKEASDRKVGGYSKGMVQRLAIAQALLGSPPLLILDEPTSGLDPRGTSMVKGIVRDYTRNGGTVFFSSHILPNVQEVADRVGIISKGKLQAVDSVENLRDDLNIPSKLHIQISGDRRMVIDVLRSDERVDNVFTRGDWLTVVCKSDHKRAVMRSIEDQGVDIVNFSTEEGDLEDIFMKYAGGVN